MHILLFKGVSLVFFDVFLYLYFVLQSSCFILNTYIFCTASPVHSAVLTSGYLRGVVVLWPNYLTQRETSIPAPQSYLLVLASGHPHFRHHPALSGF